MGRKRSDNTELACAEVLFAFKSTQDKPEPSRKLVAFLSREECQEEVVKHAKEIYGSDSGQAFNEFLNQHRGIYLHVGHKDASTYRNVLELNVNYPVLSPAGDAKDREEAQMSILKGELSVQESHYINHQTASPKSVASGRDCLTCGPAGNFPYHSTSFESYTQQQITDYSLFSANSYQSIEMPPGTASFCYLCLGDNNDPDNPVHDTLLTFPYGIHFDKHVDNTP